MTQQEPVTTVNPRSSGEITTETYRKTSDELGLAAEAGELRRCSTLALEPEYVRVPELVSFEKDNNALTTKLIEGRSVFDSIWNPTSLLGKLRGKRKAEAEVVCKNIVGTGQWLSNYHQTSVHSTGDTEAAKWLTDSFLSKTKSIRDNKLMSAQKISKIEKRFLGEVQNLTSADYRDQNNISICQIHGDFIVYNMLVDDSNNIHVIDFGDTRVAANIDDVARFYSNLIAIAHTNGSRRKLMSDTGNKFLTAYGFDQNIVESPYFETIIAYNYLIHLNGQFAMKHLSSFYLNYELGQITKAGLKWIDKRI